MSSDASWVRGRGLFSGRECAARFASAPPAPGIWIGRESGAQMGGELFSDALSDPSGPAPTYVSMFKNNVPKLVDGMLMNGS